MERLYEIFKIFLTETTLFSVEFVLVIKAPHSGIFVCCQVPCTVLGNIGGLTSYYTCLLYRLMMCSNGEFMGLYIPFQ